MSLRCYSAADLAAIILQALQVHRGPNNAEPEPIPRVSYYTVNHPRPIAAVCVEKLVLTRQSLDASRHHQAQRLDNYWLLLFLPKLPNLFLNPPLGLLPVVLLRRTSLCHSL